MGEDYSTTAWVHLREVASHWKGQSQLPSGTISGISRRRVKESSRGHTRSRKKGSPHIKFKMVPSSLALLFCPVLKSRSPVEGKGNQCLQTALYEFVFSSCILSKGDSRRGSISTVSVGSRFQSVGATLFAATPVAGRVFVLTLRILANGKCFFMLRSGKFNNTLAEGSCWVVKIEWIWRRLVT